MNGEEKVLHVIDLGRQPYRPVWDFQKQLQQLRMAHRIPDTLVLVEHDPVYTIGKNGTDLHVVASETFLKSRGIEIVHVDRGGDVTYHGPGQLVGYPIFDLHQHRQSVSWYMRQLEEVFIRLLREWGVEADRQQGYTGVWVGEDKIVALGVRISRWVTLHGFAFNVNTDLSFYDGIIPCGLFHRGVTSLTQLLDRPVTLEEVKPQVVEQFRQVFSFQNVAFRKPEQLPVEDALAQRLGKSTASVAAPDK
ncbi:MAG: lipoyl(octanoyl) transferase LipB [Calditrichaeota bacterium]|nr:lipoyl(octanoyl) transferase LipB [Calditrichota bacterium]